MKKKGGYKKKSGYKKKTANYYKKKYAKKKFAKKKKNAGARAGLLRAVSFRNIGARPLVKATAVFRGGYELDNISGSGSFARQVFRGNGAYDADYTSSLTQSPNNWADIASLGLQYYCYCSEISIRVLPSAAAGNFPDVRVMLIASTSVTPDSAGGPKLSALGNLGPNVKQVALGVLGSPNPIRRMYMKRSPKAMIPMSNPENFRSGMSSTPSNQFYYTVWAYDSIGSTGTTLKVAFEVTIKYHLLIFNEPAF